MGMTGNNGTTNVAYVQSTDDRAARRPDATSATAGLFRDGTKTGSAATADFSMSYDAYNSDYQGSAGGVYTVCRYRPGVQGIPGAVSYERIRSAR